MDIKYLKDEEYLPELLSAIGSAKTSVYAIIYLCKYVRKRQNDQAKQVIDYMINRHYAGVDVKIIFHVGQHVRRIPGWNLLVFNDLKKIGMNVKIWKQRRILHAKTIIIDNKLVFLGSHNISNTSLRESAELSVLISGDEQGKKAAIIFDMFWQLGII